MGISDKEARRRRQEEVQRARGSKHPITAIEKRVIESEAFSRLAPSSVVVMLLLAHMQAKDKNGHMQLSEATAARHGIERKTLRRAIAQLEQFGFIAKTKQGGKVEGHCNKWAFTWQPIKDREGLDRDRLDLFEPFAYDRPSAKTVAPKCPQASAKNVPLSVVHDPKMSLTQGTFSTHKSINTNAECLLDERLPALSGEGCTGDHVAAMSMHGLDGKHSFQIPVRRTLQ